MKKKIGAFIAGVLALSVMTGTWAFFSATSTLDNPFDTLSYGQRTVEEFTPKQDFEPGKEITKDVGVTNTGDYDLVVRIKMVETWTRTGETTPYIKFDSQNGKFNTVVRTGTAANYTYTANQVDHDGVDGDIDGLVAGDDSIIYKTYGDPTKVSKVYASTLDWYLAPDGYYYYNHLLHGKDSTGSLITGVAMADNADMGYYEPPVKYYSTTEQAVIAPLQAAYDAATTTAAKQAALQALETAYAWSTTEPAEEDIRFIKSESKIDDTKQGYANSEYVLSIITEVCQATKDAVNATWTTGVPSQILALCK